MLVLDSFLLNFVGLHMFGGRIFTLHSLETSLQPKLLHTAYCARVCFRKLIDEPHEDQTEVLGFYKSTTIWWLQLDTTIKSH